MKINITIYTQQSKGSFLKNTPEVKAHADKIFKFLSDPLITQTDKQKLSKSTLFGYRKPVTDECGTWCNCTIPNLTHSRGKGTAFCLRCSNNYYH